MDLTIKGVKINYVQYGKKNSKEVVLLHGWGQNIEMMNPVGEGLKNDCHVTILDFPGFGLSEEPKVEWTLNDYYFMIDEFLDVLKIKNPILIGHSFGGRVSIMYASNRKCEKLVLFGTPFKASNKKISLKIKMFRVLKKIPILKKLENFVKKHIGSRDYRNASPIMRNILVSVVNIDLTDNVKRIECPTILIWGTNDNEVPIEDGRELEMLFKDAALIEYEASTHYAYLEKLYQTISIIKNFIK